MGGYTKSRRNLNTIPPHSSSTTAEEKPLIFKLNLFTLPFISQFLRCFAGRSCKHISNSSENIDKYFYWRTHIWLNCLFFSVCSLVQVQFWCHRMLDKFPYFQWQNIIRTLPTKSERFCWVKEKKKENNRPGVWRKDKETSTVGCSDSQICIEKEVFTKKINLRSM